MRELYAINMPDCATPAFCSLSKTYIGEMDDFFPIINRLRGVPGYEDTVEAFDEFLLGNKTATHSVAYAQQVLLEPVKVISRKMICLGDTVWEHINVWGYPYTLKTTHAEVLRVAVRYHEKNCIFCRACFHDLSYETSENRWHRLDGCFWGNEWVMQVCPQVEDHYTVSNLLFIMEAQYDTEEQMMAALSDDSTIQFEEIMNEVFGDG